MPEYSQKISKIRIKKKYQEDYDFNEFCRTYVRDVWPLNKLQEVVDYLKLFIPLGTEELIKYF